MPPEKTPTEKMFATLIDVLDANGEAWEETALALDAIAAQTEQEPAAASCALQFLAEKLRSAAVSCYKVAQDSRDTLSCLLETQAPPQQANRVLPFRQ